MVKYNSLADRKSAATGLVNVFAVANILERNLPIHKILIFAAAIVPVFSEPNRFATAIFPANVPVKPFCPGTILTQITRHIFYTHGRKQLFNKIHYFVHLNFSISLLLAFLVFIVGIDTAVGNRVTGNGQANKVHYQKAFFSLRLAVPL